MTAPRRRSFLATPLAMVALGWAVCASAAGTKGTLLSGAHPPTIMIAPIHLGCDSTIVDSIVDPSQVDSFSIAIPVTQVISLSVAAFTPSGGFNPEWRLFDVHGNQVLTFGTFALRATHLLVGPLSVSGSPYRLDVRDHDDDATGKFAVRFERLAEGQTCETFNLVCDVPHTDSLTSIVDSDLFRFTASSCET